MEMVQKELEKLSIVAEDNARILKNGLRDRVSKIETSIHELTKVVVEAMKPAAAVSPWKKFAFKWLGTFIILTMFLGLMWVTFQILPASAASSILDTLLQRVGG